MRYIRSKYLVFLLSSLSLFIHSSCEDVVDIDLDTAEPKIVIDAEILWEKGTDGSQQTIEISRLTDYYNTEIPKVTGAEVTIENQQGAVFEFVDSGNGIYSCNNFVPELQMSYTLNVVVEGHQYTATEIMSSVPEIIGVVQNLEEDFSGEEVIEVQFSFQDPVDEINYYLIEFDTNILFYPEYDVERDEFTNGNIVKSEFSDEDLKVGDTVEITHRGISEQFYNYMNLIIESSSANPFATPPGNIRGNIISESDKEDYALGYFRLCEADLVTHIVE